MKDFHGCGLEVGFLTFPHNFLVNTFYTYVQRRVVNCGQTKGMNLVISFQSLPQKGEKKKKQYCKAVSSSC